MSKLRPECGDAPSDAPCLDYKAAYFRILQAVSRRRGLIHGHLEDKRGHCCAIGATFNDGVKVLPTKVIDEVALYNDSFPNLTEKERRAKVSAWLRFRISEFATDTKSGRKHA